MKEGYEANIDWVLEPTGMTVEELKKHPLGMMAPQDPLIFKEYEKKGFKTPTGKIECSSEVLRKCQSHDYDPLPTYRPPEVVPLQTGLAKVSFYHKYRISFLPMFIHTRTFRLPWTRACAQILQRI